MRSEWTRRRFLKTGSKSVGAVWLWAEETRVNLGAPDSQAILYLVPNTHGTVAGWLVNFDTERNYCLNNYLDHLDRVASDENYRFAFSEVPNLISFLQFVPNRLEELKARVRERRVELCNGFFLESTVNLSGGEALVQLGVQGLRWYETVFGIRPRLGWTIDIVGNHRQMPQIVAGLGLEAMIFCRNNPAEKTAFWWVAPDGTRALTLCNSNDYSEFPKVFTTKEPLDSADLEKIAEVIEWKKAHSPSQKTLLALGGSADYSLAPARKEYPTEFLRQWKARHPESEVRFSIPSDYVDALREEIQAGKVHLEEYQGDTAYCFNAFWFDMPQIKRRFRCLEHQLQAAEMLATVASLRGDFPYPSQDFHDAWINLLMNMDRNALWGAGAGSGFRDSKSWDVEDRYASVEELSSRIIDDSLKVLGGEGDHLVLFNPLNWERRAPVEILLPRGKGIVGAACEARLDDPSSVLCQVNFHPVALSSLDLEDRPPQPPQPVNLEDEIETDNYRVRIDQRTGALVSLKLKASGQEFLGGPGNVVVAETLAGILEDSADFMLPRPQRKVLQTSNDYTPQIRAYRGPLTTTLVIQSDFYKGSKLERTIRFYHHHPRIDFEVRLDLRADDVLITVDFPWRDEILERARGIPFGFAAFDPRRPFRPRPEYRVGESQTHGFSDAILPAVRWSHYQFPRGEGVALLDRGLTGHELNGSTLTLGLVNAQPDYHKLPNDLLGGQGVHRFEYALLPHTGTWSQAKIPQAAWEFNAPVLSRVGGGRHSPQTYLHTSDNVIVEAMRREGRQIEVRFVEWEGRPGEADLRLGLRHQKAFRTDLLGEKPALLEPGPPYHLPVRPQQIVTVRFDVDSAVLAPKIVQDWTNLVPPAKRQDLKRRIHTKGHPPFGK